MDPTTCYIAMLEATREHDYSRAREYALILKSWLESGGFYPKGFEKNNVHILLGRILRPACRPASLKSPFQNIQCTYCDAGDHIINLEQAIDEGWAGIELADDYPHASHLGTCPDCRRNEDEDFS